jgi:hypothetical protein
MLPRRSVNEPRTTRYVRRAFLLEDGKSNRKEWLENRIKELAEIFPVYVDGYSVILLWPLRARARTRGFSLAVNLTRTIKSSGGAVSRADSPPAGLGRG